MRHHGRNARRRGLAVGPGSSPSLVGGVRRRTPTNRPRRRRRRDADADARARRRPARPRRRRSCRPTPDAAADVLHLHGRRGRHPGSIARRFKTSARSIAYWNRATLPVARPGVGHYNPNYLKVGWVLAAHPERRGRPGGPADPDARRLSRRPSRRPIAIVWRWPAAPTRPADRRDRRGRGAPDRPGARRAQERALRASVDATRRRAGRPRRDVDDGDRGGRVRDDGRPAAQRRRRPPPGALRPAEPRLGRRSSRTATRSSTRPGPRRRRGPARARASAAASRRSTRSRAARSSSTSTATRARAGAAARRRPIRCGSRPARDWPGSSSRPTPAAGSCASTATTTRRVRPSDLAPGSSPTPGRAARPATWSRRSRRPTVGSSFGVQCHPERTESTPRPFERLFASSSTPMPRRLRPTTPLGALARSRVSRLEPPGLDDPLEELARPRLAAAR